MSAEMTVLDVMRKVAPPDSQLRDTSVYTLYFSPSAELKVTEDGARRVYLEAGLGEAENLISHHLIFTYEGDDVPNGTISEEDRARIAAQFAEVVDDIAIATRLDIYKTYPFSDEELDLRRDSRWSEKRYRTERHALVVDLTISSRDVTHITPHIQPFIQAAQEFSL